jgi:hypothetical protein
MFFSADILGRKAFYHIYYENCPLRIPEEQILFFYKTRLVVEHYCATETRRRKGRCSGIVRQ